jgi:uncharacterized protein YacL
LYILYTIFFLEQYYIQIKITTQIKSWVNEVCSVVVSKSMIHQTLGSFFSWPWGQSPAFYLILCIFLLLFLAMFFKLWICLKNEILFWYIYSHKNKRQKNNNNLKKKKEKKKKKKIKIKRFNSNTTTKTFIYSDTY